MAGGLPAGTRLGRYEVLLPLGNGGAGAVYLARAAGPNGFEKRFALKVLHPVAGARAALTEEAKLLVGLQHSNVVQLFELGREGEVDFVAMEYVDGMSLDEALRRARRAARPFPVGIALYVGVEMCKALHVVHGRLDTSGRSLGLVHRDVSPSNILLSRAGEVKLADFGIARPARRGEGITQPGFVKGKLGYMAPEQAKGEPLDGRADLFALGVCLFEAITGQNPFLGPTDSDSYQRNLAGRLPPPSQMGTGADRGLDAFFATANAIDLAARFRDSAAMRSALAALPAARDLADPDLALARLLEQLASTPAVERPLADAARRALGEPSDDAGAAPVPPTREIDAARVAGASASARRKRPVVLLATGVLAAAGAMVVVRGPTFKPAASTPISAVAGPPRPTVPDLAPIYSIGVSTSAGRQPLGERAPERPGRAALDRRIADRAPAPDATLQVNVDPWAEVVVDGEELGVVPRRKTVSAGRHTLTLRNPSLKLERSVTVELAAGQVLTVSEWPKAPL